MKKIIVCLSLLLGWNVNLFASAPDAPLTCPDGSALTKGMSVTQVRDQCNNHAYLTAQPTQTSWTEQVVYTSKYPTTTYFYTFLPKTTQFDKKRLITNSASSAKQKMATRVALKTKQAHLFRILVQDKPQKSLLLCGQSLYMGISTKNFATLCGGASKQITITSKKITDQHHTVLTLNPSRSLLVKYLFINDELIGIKK